MTFVDALKKIKKQKVEVWTEADNVRIALQLMKTDAMQRQAAAMEELVDTIHNELVWIAQFGIRTRL